MAYGVNRRQALGDACGHPAMAHYGSACHCGCIGVLPRAPTLSPDSDAHSAIVEELLKFVQWNMSAREADRSVLTKACGEIQGSGWQFS
jgi:hypothetical protein